jgi:choline dehydrogenase-like flavoprotein
VRVVDASVRPDVVRANTNVTTMMIAERAADFIKEGRCISAAARGDQASNP